MRTEELYLSRYDYISLLVHFHSHSLIDKKHREDLLVGGKLQLLPDLLLVKAREVDLLDVAHVEDIL